MRFSQGGAFHLREGLLDDAAAFDQHGLCVFGAACVDLTGIFENLKLSGDEVDYANAVILPVKIILCCKLHCQRVLKLKVFSYTIHPHTPVSGVVKPGFTGTGVPRS